MKRIWMNVKTQYRIAITEGNALTVFAGVTVLQSALSCIFGPLFFNVFVAFIAYTALSALRRSLTAWVVLSIRRGNARRGERRFNVFRED